MRLHTTLKFLLVAATLGALSGCVTTPHEPLKYSKGYEPIYPTAPVAEKAATGSLFANSADSLVGRGKNFRVGDIITVLLSESAQANRSQTRDTSRAATNSLPSGASTKVGNISPFLDGINLNESTIESAGSGTAGQSATLRGEVAVTDWEFNAWGGKFPPWDLDNAIPSRIATSLGMRRFNGGMILEGGAIEVNGRGQLLTTEAVLLNPNRNPQLDRATIEQKLREGLGVTDILWLKQGIVGDDTDGHIDDLARFIDETTILACVESSSQSANRAVLDDNLARLRSFHGPDARPFEVIEIPLPEACEIPGWRLPVLPASYVNFLIVNGGVLVPTFRQRKNDDRALGMIRELFPDREITGIDCLELVEEGGTLHPFPTDPVELYALADAESAIDAGALLRERVIADPPRKVLGKEGKNWLMHDLLPVFDAARERLEITGSNGQRRLGFPGQSFGDIVAG